MNRQNQKSEFRKQNSEDRTQKSKSVLCGLSSVPCGIVLVGLSLFLRAGCEQMPVGEEYYEIKLPPEKLRHIETLELAEAKESERPDVNEAKAPPDELELTLEQCRAMAMENNLDIKVQLISPAIDAGWVSEEEARFEAAFFSNINYSKSDMPAVSFLDEITGSQRDYTSTDLGVQVPLRTGGTVTFDLADTRTK